MRISGPPGRLGPSRVSYSDGSRCHPRNVGENPAIPRPRATKCDVPSRRRILRPTRVPGTRTAPAPPLGAAATGGFAADARNSKVFSAQARRPAAGRAAARHRVAERPCIRLLTALALSTGSAHRRTGASGGNLPRLPGATGGWAPPPDRPAAPPERARVAPRPASGGFTRRITTGEIPRHPAEGGPKRRIPGRSPRPGGDPGRVRAILETSGRRFRNRARNRAGAPPCLTGHGGARVGHRIVAQAPPPRGSSRTPAPPATQSADF